MIEIAVFMTLAGMVHVLKEMSHIWGKSTTRAMRFDWMYNDWWLSSSPRRGRTWYNVIFADSYHTFANFIKLFMAVVICVTWYLDIPIYIAPDIYNLFALLCWPVSRYLTFKLFIKKV